MRLRSDETELVGTWKLQNGKMTEDDVSLRIRKLTDEELRLIAESNGGWSKLFQDPTDQRYWELTYPSSDSYGGGPAALRLISPPEARKKYDV